jgi:putative glutamine amidotransferase
VLLGTEARSLDDLDGLLLPGGWDVDPQLYDEPPAPNLGEVDRDLDDAEIRLFEEARARALPVLGICRGQQVINVALGGKLEQHIDEHDVRAHGRKHLAHAIEVDQDSELGRAAGAAELAVNSLHHQSISRLAPGLRATARSQDGVIEGLESEDGLVVAVQCHPEELTGELAWAETLFKRFVARAGAARC